MGFNNQQSQYILYFFLLLHIFFLKSRSNIIKQNIQYRLNCSKDEFITVFQIVQNVQMIIASKVFILSASKEEWFAQVISEETEAFIGIETSHQVANRLQKRAICGHEKKIWFVDSPVDEQTRHRTESRSIPLSLSFNRVGIRFLDIRHKRTFNFRRIRVLHLVAISELPSKKL